MLLEVGEGVAFEDYNPDQVRAIIIDDHDPIRKSIRRVVTGLGIRQIIECFDGNDAIKHLNEKHIDLVLCDIYMRKISGFDILQYVRQRDVGSDIPFILISGEGSKDDIVKSSNLGADFYIIKPFQADDLEQKIKQALQNYYNPTPLLRALRYGDRLVMSGQYKAAFTAFESALELDPKSQRAKHSLACTFLLSGQRDVGESLLKENIRKAPSYYKNYETLANLYLKEKSIDLAIDTMGRELSLNPKQAERQAQLGQLLLKKGNAADAIGHFRLALQENPRHGPSLMGMGQAYSVAEDSEKAIYYLKRLRRHHPKSTKALTAIVKHCLNANIPRKAELALLDEKRLHPERFDTYTVLATFYALTNRSPEALKTLEELFCHDKDNIDGLQIKGQIEIDSKRWDLAIQTFSRLAKLQPSHDIYLSLADSLFHLNRHKECLDILNKAILTDPNNPKSNYLLSLCFKETKQYGKAYAMMLQARKYGWDSQEASRRLKELRASIQSRQKELVDQQPLRPILRGA
jgi:two-component system chemotaxis response regulator CheY